MATVGDQESPSGESERTEKLAKDFDGQAVGNSRQGPEPTMSCSEGKKNAFVDSDKEDGDETDKFVDAVEEINDVVDSAKAEEECADKDKGSEEEAEEREADEGPEEENMTDEQKEQNKIEAQENKTKGNEYFKNSEYPEAKEYYTRAIRICPRQFAKERAVFYANRAACLVKMDLYKEATEDCTKALELNPEYIKARLRRAQCYEHEDRLEEALEDYQKVFDVDRSSYVAREALMRLPEQIKIKHEKMKEEMLGKLKDLGNVFLKPFGLSTNNFKMQQDPNSGGYNISFQK